MPSERRTVSVRVNVGADRDVVRETRRLSDFLWKRVSGDIAEAAVVEFLRRTKAQAVEAPWVPQLPELERAADAVTRADRLPLATPAQGGGKHE